MEQKLPYLVTTLWFITVSFLVLFHVAFSLASLVRRHRLLPFIAEHQIGREKRHDPRIPTDRNTYAIVSNGTTSCTGQISNISRLGIGLKNLPDKLFDEFDRLTVILKRNKLKYSLVIEPRWVTLDNGTINLGASLISPPDEWHDFLSELSDLQTNP